MKKRTKNIASKDIDTRTPGPKPTPSTDPNPQFNQPDAIDEFIEHQKQLYHKTILQVILDGHKYKDFQLGY